MSTEALEERKSTVPALAPTPATEITAEDVSLPRVYIGQFISNAVQHGLVKAGQIFVALGADDPDPQTVYDPEAKDTAKLGRGLLFHPIALRKGKSLQVDGRLETWQFEDPSAPKEAWTTYTYLIAIPEIDTDVPAKWLLTRSGKPAALQINTVLKKNASKGSIWLNAFRATTDWRENEKGKFAVPRIRPAEASTKDVELAERFAVELSGSSADVKATGDEPEL